MTFLYSRAESEGVEVRVMDECIACLTFMQETRDCLLSQITNLHLFMSHYHNPFLFPCTDTVETEYSNNDDIEHNLAFCNPTRQCIPFFLHVAQLHHTLLAVYYQQSLIMLIIFIFAQTAFTNFSLHLNIKVTSLIHLHVKRADSVFARNVS